MLFFLCYCFSDHEEIRLIAIANEQRFGCIDGSNLVFPRGSLLVDVVELLFAAFPVCLTITVSPPVFFFNVWGGGYFARKWLVDVVCAT